MPYTNNLILGVNIDSEPLVWNWSHENSLAVVGKGGSGKTTASIYWLSQLAAQGVRFLMADPHMANKESLYAQTGFLHDAFIQDCVSKYESIMDYIQLFHTIGADRVSGKETIHYPLVFVIDEFTSFVINYSAAKAATLKLLDSLNQYRKVQLRIFLIGQSWGQAVRVVSGMRDALSSVVVLKSSFNDASKFCAMPQTAREAMTLQPGEGFYQDEKIWIPRVTSTDKLVVARRVHAFQHTKEKEVKDTYLYPNERMLHAYAARVIA